MILWVQCAGQHPASRLESAVSAVNSMVRNGHQAGKTLLGPLQSSAVDNPNTSVAAAPVWPRKERGLSCSQHGARGQRHSHGGAHSHQRLGGTQHKVSFCPLQIIFAKGTFPGHPIGHHPKSLTKHWPCAQSYLLQHSM